MKKKTVLIGSVLFCALVMTLMDTFLELSYGPRSFLKIMMGKGCRAGFSLVSINVDGLLAPCRHLYEYEAFRNLEDYWNNSPILNQIRSARDDLRQPCAQCRYQPNCVHCLAINRLIHGEYYFGNQFCGLSESAK